jgi:phenylacetate-coenzyme A ligase PaaK-like adenylate-forming protein
MTADTLAPSTQRRQLTAALERLPEHIARLSWDADRLRRHQEAALRRLLRVAVDASPFHARRLAGVELESVTLDDLAFLPVMTKAGMMAELDDVFTDRRLTRTVVEEHLARLGRSAEYLFDEHLVLASGGSSGERGVFVYGFDAFVDYALSIARSAMARLVASGATATAAFVAAPSTVHATGAVAAVLGPGGPVEITPLSAAAPLPDLVAALGDLQPSLLMGYPSVLARLAAEQQAGRLRIAPVSVLATSEPLTPATRARITDAFGVPPTDSFGSTEGLCGVSAPGEEAIVFASDTCIAEVEDGRVLVTNLVNPVQPLIRYELTDHVTVLPPDPSHGHLRGVVVGRNDPPFRYGDVEVHPSAVRAALLAFPDVFEHQVRQTIAGVDVDVVATPGVDLTRVRDRLRAALVAAGLPEPHIGVRTVDAVPRSALSGKPQRFVPLA